MLVSWSPPSYLVHASAYRRIYIQTLHKQQTTDSSSQSKKLGAHTSVGETKLEKLAVLTRNRGASTKF